MRALRFGIAGAFAVFEAVGAAILVAASSHEANPWLTGGFAITAGLTFIAAGLVALWRRPENGTGFWLAATGYLWFPAALSEADGSWPWTVGFVMGNLALVTFSALILAYPDGRLGRRDVWLVSVGGVTAIGGNALVALLDSSPATRCDNCPGSAIAIADRPGAAEAVTIVATIIIVAVLGAIAAILVQRWREASATSRRSLRLVYVTCGTSVALLLVSVAADRISSIANSVTWVLFLTSFALVPGAFLVGVLRSRWDRSAATRMLVSLDAGIPLRDTLAQALHDPSLEIVYRLDDRDEWVDASGRRVAEPVGTEERAVTTVERNGLRIAALVHDPVLADEPETIELVAAAVGLPLENMRLQADMRSQLGFLATLVDTVPSLFIHVDLDGKIVNQNVAALDAAGTHEAERVRGQFFWDVFVDPAERDEVVARFRAAAPTHPAAEYENTFVNERGEERSVFWRAAPLPDEQGRTKGIIVGGIDVGELKQREVQLQRERDITATLMQAIPSVVVVVDDQGTIVDSGVDETRAGVNEAFRDLLGWTDAELVRRSVLELIDPSDGYFASRAIASAATGTASDARESRWLKADGSHVMIAWTATPVADVTMRRSSLVLLSGVDVTERNRQDEEIRASRSRIIETADSTRRVLERNLHDGAQQHLVALSVSLRLAESRLETDPDGAATILVGAREELAAALEELRELARGIHPAVLTDRGLPAAVEALVLRTPFPVEVEVPDERLPTAVEAAAYYVVAESLTNVAKYAKATSARVFVRQTPDGTVVVEVADNGVGGADPTFGTGLRGLGDRLGALDGTLTVESPPGRGTRIIAVIPALDRGRRFPRPQAHPRRLPREHT